MEYTINNRLIVETYKNEGLKTETKNGFAMISQKITLKGLKVLIDAKLADGTYVRAGSKAYIKEEILHTQPWAKKVLECDTLSTPFIIVDMQYVEFISHADDGPTVPAA